MATDGSVIRADSSQTGGGGSIASVDKFSFGNPWQRSVVGNHASSGLTLLNGESHSNLGTDGESSGGYAMSDGANIDDGAIHTLHCYDVSGGGVSIIGNFYYAGSTVTAIIFTDSTGFVMLSWDATLHRWVVRMVSGTPGFAP